MAKRQRSLNDDNANRMVGEIPRDSRAAIHGHIDYASDGMVNDLKNPKAPYGDSGVLYGSTPRPNVTIYRNGIGVRDLRAGQPTFHVQKGSQSAGQLDAISRMLAGAAQKHYEDQLKNGKGRP